MPGGHYREAKQGTSEVNMYMNIDAPSERRYRKLVEAAGFVIPLKLLLSEPEPLKRCAAPLQRRKL
jgi:hypothetical protein